ncbi:MAG: hypothetical protein ABSB09_00250 [Acidimicrobiales bacterium]|jgi:hypothetical protein
MATKEHEPPAPEDGATIERLEHLLEEWRSRIDVLLVQADLASKDVGESVRDKAAIAENAYLAAANRLSQIPKDAGANLGSMRDGIEQLFDDLRDAYRSAEAVIRRGRGD